MLSGTGSPVKLSGCRATDAGIDGDGDLPDMARMGGEHVFEICCRAWYITGIMQWVSISKDMAGNQI